jgi:hypothetical protein
MFLVLRVAVVSAAEERQIAICATFRLWRRIGDERTIRVVREIEPARSIQTFDSRAGVDLQPLHENGSIHDELQRTELRCPVEDALNERRIFGAAAFGDVTIELRTRLAGDDDVGDGAACRVASGESRMAVRSLRVCFIFIAATKAFRCVRGSLSFHERPPRSHFSARTLRP